MDAKTENLLVNYLLIIKQQDDRIKELEQQVENTTKLASAWKEAYENANAQLLEIGFELSKFKYKNKIDILA